jgi:hypothetical protein
VQLDTEHIAVNDKKQMTLSGFMLLDIDRCTEWVSLGNLWTMVTETGVVVEVQSEFRTFKIQPMEIWSISISGRSEQ